MGDTLLNDLDRDVALFASTGMTDDEIGGRLELPVVEVRRRVERLRTIYAARSRADLAVAVLCGATPRPTGDGGETGS